MQAYGNIDVCEFIFCHQCSSFHKVDVEKFGKVRFILTKYSDCCSDCADTGEREVSTVNFVERGRMFDERF